MFGKRRLSQLGITLLLGGACACSAQKNSSKEIPFDPAGYEGFDETQFHLLAADCSYSNGDMTLTVAANETAYLFKRASDALVVANANIAGVECTVASTKKIIINGGTGDQKVIVDFYTGTFNLATTSTPNIAIDLGAGTGDTVKVRGTTANDLITMGSTTGSTVTSYLAISTVGATPVRTTADISMLGVENIVVSAGAGNDNITAQGGAAVGHTSTNTVGPLDGTITLTVYGGDGDDTLTGGAASVLTRNTLNGGAGNDYFPQAAGLSADTINGGAGIDTVDYGARASAIRATLGATTAAVAASGSFTCVAKASIADNDSFTIAADSTHSKTFAYNVTGSGAYATGTVVTPTRASLTDGDYFIVSDGTHTKTFAYQKVANVYPSGSITVTGGASPTVADGDTVTVKDVDGTTVTFRFAIGTSSQTAGAGEELVVVGASPSAGDIADALATQLGQTRSPAFKLSVTHTSGNAAITLTGTTTYGTGYALSQSASGMTLVGMANGSASVVDPATSVAIDVTTNGLTAAQVAAATASAITGVHGAGFTVSVSPAYASGTTVSLKNDAKNAGNVAIDVTGISAGAVTGGFAVTGMAGGAAFFVESAGNTTANAIIIDVSAVSSAAAVCGLTYTAIHGAHDATAFAVSATDPAGLVVIPLVNDATGAAGNQTITRSTGANFTVTGMVNGAALITNDDGDIASAELDSIAADVENVIGSSMNDTINGSASAVVHVFMGMDGNDRLVGGSLTNFLYGGKGSDTLIGGGIADFLYGGDGDDTLQGGLGDDTIGGGGVNCIAAVANPAIVTPPITPSVPFINAVACPTAAATGSTTSPGSDTIDYSDRSNAVTVDLTQVNTATCATGHNMGEATECDVIAPFGTGATAVSSIKNIRGGGGADTLKGDAQANMIWGGNGIDTITGGLGNDALYGEAGNDIIYGNDGNNAAIASTLLDNDYINGGPGTNTLKGDDGLDAIDSSLGSTDAVDCGLGDGDISLPNGTEASNTGCEL
jgi:Ca2+-binding RTX toxin-like protein